VLPYAAASSFHVQKHFATLDSNDRPARRAGLTGSSARLAVTGRPTATLVDAESRVKGQPGARYYGELLDMPANRHTGFNQDTWDATLARWTSLHGRPSRLAELSGSRQARLPRSWPFQGKRCSGGLRPACCQPNEYVPVASTASSEQRSIDSRPSSSRRNVQQRARRDDRRRRPDTVDNGPALAPDTETPARWTLGGTAQRVLLR